MPVQIVPETIEILSIHRECNVVQRYLPEVEAVWETLRNLEKTYEEKAKQQQRRLDADRISEEASNSITYAEKKMDMLRILLGELFKQVDDVDKLRAEICSASMNDERVGAIVDVAILHSCGD